MAWARAKLAVTLLVLVMMNLVGRRSGDGASERTAMGAIEVVGRAGAALSREDLASISLHVYNSSAGYDQTYATTSAGATWYINIPDLPVSQAPYTFEASAYDSTGQLGSVVPRTRRSRTAWSRSFQNYAPAMMSVTATKRKRRSASTTGAEPCRR